MDQHRRRPQTSNPSHPDGDGLSAGNPRCETNQLSANESSPATDDNDVQGVAKTDSQGTPPQQFNRDELGCPAMYTVNNRAEELAYDE